MGTFLSWLNWKDFTDFMKKIYVWHQKLCCLIQTNQAYSGAYTLDSIWNHWFIQSSMLMAVNVNVDATCLIWNDYIAYIATWLKMIMIIVNDGLQTLLDGGMLPWWWLGVRLIWEQPDLTLLLDIIARSFCGHLKSNTSIDILHTRITNLQWKIIK